MRATTQTVPLRQLLKELPDLAEVLIGRYGIERTSLAEYHVLLVEDVPSIESGRVGAGIRSARIITTAVIVDRPIKVGVHGVGVSVKGPDDIHDRTIGRSIAISRAIRRAATRLSGGR